MSTERAGPGAAERATAGAVAALILAGGQSRRFGRDKARYPVGGRPMIRRVYDAASVVATPVFVSVRTDGTSFETLLPAATRYVADADVEEAALQHEQADRRDDTEGQGPLAGLAAGLAAISTSWGLALACDLPFLTPGVLGRVVAARSPAADAVVAQTPDGQAHPLCACYRRDRALPVARQHLKDGRLALRDLLARLDVRFVSVEAAPLRNVNRLSDL